MSKPIIEHIVRECLPEDGHFDVELQTISPDAERKWVVTNAIKVDCLKFVFPRDWWMPYLDMIVRVAFIKLHEAVLPLFDELAEPKISDEDKARLAKGVTHEALFRLTSTSDFDGKENLIIIFRIAP